MDPSRSTIDPAGLYPADGLRVVERNALRVLAILPDALLTRTRDVIQIEHGSEGGIVVVVTAEAFEIRLPRFEWTQGTHGPALASVLWRRAEALALTDEALRELIEAGHAARKAQFATCRFCGGSFPEERRHGNVCHGCAENRLGMVH